MLTHEEKIALKNMLGICLEQFETSGGDIDYVGLGDNSPKIIHDIIEKLTRHKKAENNGGTDYRTCYDLITSLQEELSAQHHDAEIGCIDYKIVKALAATYELQDYLADRIARTVNTGELEPELDY